MPHVKALMEFKAPQGQLERLGQLARLGRQGLLALPDPSGLLDLRVMQALPALLAKMERQACKDQPATRALTASFESMGQVRLAR